MVRALLCLGGITSFVSLSSALRTVICPSLTSVHISPRISPARSPASAASSTTARPHKSATTRILSTSGQGTEARSPAIPAILKRSFDLLPVTYLISVDSTARRLLTVFALRPRSSTTTNPSTFD
jgi:hypothetical protein